MAIAPGPVGRLGSGGSWSGPSHNTRFDSCQRGRSCHLRSLWAFGMAASRCHPIRGSHWIPAHLLPLSGHRGAAEWRLSPHRLVARVGSVCARLRRHSLSQGPKRANWAGRIPKRTPRVPSRGEYGRRGSGHYTAKRVAGAPGRPTPSFARLELRPAHALSPPISCHIVGRRPRRGCRRYRVL